MKILPLVLGFCLSGAALEAAAPHPTLLTVKYKDQLLPVAKVYGSDPVVLVSGKEKRIRTKVAFIPQRTAAFGEGFLTFLSKQVSFIRNPGPSSAQPLNGAFYLDATVRSKETIHGGFILVAISTIGRGAYDSTLINTEYAVRSLPDLVAGVETPLKLSMAFDYVDHKADHYIQIFDSAGREIPTSEMSSAWSYYALLEKTQLRDALPQYLKNYAGTNQPVRPVVCPKPRLAPELALPEGVTATLTISSEGLVTDVYLEGVTDHTLVKAITDNISGWLFLPQLENGKPVVAKVQVPVIP